MGWRYAIVRQDAGDEVYFGLHEVYENKKGSVSWTANPITFSWYESPDELVKHLRRAADDAERALLVVGEDDAFFEEW